MSEAHPTPEGEFEEHADPYVAQRREKANKLAREGIDPFRGQAFAPSDRCGEVAAIYGGASNEALEAEPVHVAVAGRITALRRFGKAGFIDLRDGSGRLQVYVTKDKLPDDEYTRFTELVDLGDFVGVEGKLFRTRTGELTVAAERFYFLSKALRGLPEKWHGLADVETRYRQRYLDLIANDDSRQRFRQRSLIVRTIRQYFDKRGFLEVETPMMHAQATGAAARPFRTHHNALDLPLVLRIAPELHLKRLVVGGFDRVYEVNRNFRNEGVSTQHNPEFTMLEFYQAYARVDDLIDHVEQLFQAAIAVLRGDGKANGAGLVLPYQGDEIDYGRFRRMTVREAIALHCRSAIEALGDRAPVFFENVSAAARLALEVGVDPASVGRRLLEAFTRAELHKIFKSADFEAAYEPGADDLRRALERFVGDGAFRAKLIDAVDAQAESGEDPRVLAGGVAMLAFEKAVEPALIQPTFITEFPLAVSPLAARCREPDKCHLADRFELFVAGREIANGFQELNDPLEQRKRFELQERARAYGEAEAMELDEDYLRALEHGLPPTAGAGIGIDRMTMLLTDAASIRDVILFPLMRPRRA